MSNKSRTPITIYPHKQGKASLSSCKVEFFDNSGELLFDAFEWDDSSKQSPRIDLRDYYDDYEADRLYSQIEQFRITVVISYDTTACLPEAEDKFFVSSRVLSTSTRWQSVVRTEEFARGQGNVTITHEFQRDDLENMAGLVRVETSLVKACDPDTLGNTPVKIGETIYASSFGSILTQPDSTKKLEIVFDDPAGPTSQGIEIRWIDMSGTPNAQFALDYNGFDSPDETDFGITLLLNKSSNFYWLRNEVSGSPKLLRDLSISQISSNITVQLLGDLCNEFTEPLQDVIDGSRDPTPGTVLGFCWDVLQSVSRDIAMAPQDVHSVFTENVDGIKNIVLKVQNMKGIEKRYNELASRIKRE